MKQCTKCKRDLPFEMFYKNGQRLQSRCKDCFLSPKQKKQQIATVKKRTREFQNWVSDLKKDKPCLDCGAIWDPVAMDFDHRDGEIKVANIANMVRSVKSRKKVLLEIAKCDLVCACCHRLRTHKRLQNKK